MFCQVDHGTNASLQQQTVILCLLLQRMKLYVSCSPGRVENYLAVLCDENGTVAANAVPQVAHTGWEPAARAIKDNTGATTKQQSELLSHAAQFVWISSRGCYVLSFFTIDSQYYSRLGSSTRHTKIARCD